MKPEGSLSLVSVLSQMNAVFPPDFPKIRSDIIHTYTLVGAGIARIGALGCGLDDRGFKSQ